MGFPAGNPADRWMYVGDKDTLYCTVSQRRVLTAGSLVPKTGQAPGNFSNLMYPVVKQKRWQSSLIWPIHLCNVKRIKLPKGSIGNSPWSCHLYIWMLKQAVLWGACDNQKCIYSMLITSIHILKGLCCWSNTLKDWPRLQYSTLGILYVDKWKCSCSPFSEDYAFQLCPVWFPVSGCISGSLWHPEKLGNKSLFCTIDDDCLFIYWFVYIYNIYITIYLFYPLSPLWLTTMLHNKTQMIPLLMLYNASAAVWLKIVMLTYSPLLSLYEKDCKTSPLRWKSHYYNNIHLIIKHIHFHI